MQYTITNLSCSMSIAAVKAATKALVYQINKIPRYDDFLEVNIIFPCAGEAIIERYTISEVIKALPFTLVINTIYLIDIIYNENAVKIMEDIASKVVSCSYDDMNKILISTPMETVEKTVCVAIHPQLLGSSYDDEDVVPILSAMNIDMKGKSIFTLQKKLMLLSYDATKYQAGIFLRLWLGHFRKYYCNAWRDERLMMVHIDDIDLQGRDPTEIDPTEFYDIVLSNMI